MDDPHPPTYLTSNPLTPCTTCNNIVIFLIVARNNGDPIQTDVGSSSSTTTPQKPLVHTQQSQIRSQRARGHLIGNQSRNPPYVRPPSQQPPISPPTSNIGQVLTICKAIDSRLKRLEAQNSEIKSSMESVTALIEKHLQASFQIKGGIYEVNFMHLYRHNT